MPIVRTLRNPAVVAAVAAMLVSPVSADGGKPPETPKPRIAEKAPVEKAPAEKPVDPDASRYCANVAPSIAEARIAWQTKRLADLDGQIQQRIADLEKAEAAAREWIAKRERTDERCPRRPRRHLRQDGAGERGAAARRPR